MHGREAQVYDRQELSVTPELINWTYDVHSGDTSIARSAVAMKKSTPVLGFKLMGIFAKPLIILQAGHKIHNEACIIKSSARSAATFHNSSLFHDHLKPNQTEQA